MVAAVAWLQPLLDQFFGEGNLGGLLRSSSGSDADRAPLFASLTCARLPMSSCGGPAGAGIDELAVPSSSSQRATASLREDTPSLR